MVRCVAGFPSLAPKDVVLRKGKWYYEVRPTHPPTHPLVESSTHPPTHPLVQSPTHPTTHPPIQPTHPPTHPPQVTLIKAGLAQLGWGDVLFQGHSGKGEGVGDDLHSWGVDGHRVYKWHGGGVRWGCAWAEGDVLGFWADLEEKTLSFSVNGSVAEPVGLAFEDVQFVEGTSSLSLLSSSTHPPAYSPTHLRICLLSSLFHPPTVAQSNHLFFHQPTHPPTQNQAYVPASPSTNPVPSASASGAVGKPLSSTYLPATVQSSRPHETKSSRKSTGAIDSKSPLPWASRPAPWRSSRPCGKPTSPPPPPLPLLLRTPVPSGGPRCRMGVRCWGMWRPKEQEQEQEASQRRL